jgi:hypothetical protein
MARCTGMESKEASVCPQCREAVERAEACIREHPRQAALVCLGAGVLMAQLPFRWLMSVLVRMMLFLLQPAMILYGIYRFAGDVHARQPKEDADTGTGNGKI